MPRAPALAISPSMLGAIRSPKTHSSAHFVSSEANFNLMLDKTQKEQAELKERVEQGRRKLADESRLAVEMCIRDSHRPGRPRLRHALRLSF